MHPELAIEALDDTGALASAAALHVARELTMAVAERGRATLAVSGGRTPLASFALLSAARLPWDRISVLQIDERCAPAGHEDRNGVQLARAFSDVARAQPSSFYWFPADSDDAWAGARAYSATLAAVAGSPPIIDVVQLGLGADGHTASLFPDAELELVTPYVAYVPIAPLWPRLTLTLPVLNAARRVVWLVAGADKRAALTSLLAADPALVATQVRRDTARVFADRAAAGL